MRTNQITIKLGATALLMAAAAGNSAFAAEYWLQAAATTVALPSPTGPVNVPMWGYAKCEANFEYCGEVSVPGPAITVSASDNGLTVHLKNTLATPTSLVINGLVKAMAPVWTDPNAVDPTAAMNARGTSTSARVRSFDTEAAPDGTAVYTWASVKPGTYLYQSGTQPQVQVQMGLYGAAIKNAVEAEAGVTPVRAQSYAGAGFEYDNQATLLYSEIDPALHDAVADGSYGAAGSGPTSTFNYAPKYFLINGQPYPGNGVITPTGNSGTTLLRLLNAGLTTHVPMILGKYWEAVAEDGKPYPFRRNQYTALLPAAKTMDVVLTADVGAVYPIMDRRLNFSSAGESGGGMLTFLNFATNSAGSPGNPSSVGDVILVTTPDNYETPSRVALHVPAPGVLANDLNPTLPALKALPVSGPTTAGGTFVIQASGAFTYTPPAGSDIVSDTFTYRATSGMNQSAPVTVNIALYTPTAPTLEPLDNFNAPNGLLGNTWTQRVASGPANVQVRGEAATAVDTDAGGLAIWDSASQFGATQFAGFTLGGVTDKTALVLKATGGLSHAQPANYVRVRYDATGAKIVVDTAQGGSNATSYVKHAELPVAAPSGVLSASVDDKALVTVFLDGNYVGGVQLPNAAAWTGTGRIGLQLLTPDASVDNFSGGPVAP